MQVRGIAVTAALLCSIALLVGPVTAQQLSAGDWGTCGGVNGPNKQDAAGLACPSGYTCVRQDQYYWQCKENKSVPGLDAAAAPLSGGAAAPTAGAQVKPHSTQQQQQQQSKAGVKVLEPWAQCGGINGRTGGTDAQWDDVACPRGFTCIRQDE
ncbi:hypothetical protein MNEG_0976 [Monoraphidium neglectum]|jgi:hypothetical protein|uniref:CBM1 domain-containing protein n=1 Tax=Monoraphidium neglectum TaxID=145388 RepID=A0A0D2N3N5_9CHLO|nr:hypothetical protein MNEG_0976 [Monoraphidium neglectum]KIZ06982.1 hypothetical protein MNEG_0976 [Monoraphidium neglectum]|eukprot:XP_013906001.1 hypothetical protein MNEG_0976 [Monoraphidium neglectum]